MLHIAPSAIERMHPAPGYADRPEQAQALERSPSPQHQARRGKGPHGGTFARRTTGAQTATGGRRPGLAAPAGTPHTNREHYLHACAQGGYTFTVKASRRCNRLERPQLMQVHSAEFS